MSKQHFYPLLIVLAIFVCGGCSKENRPRDLPPLFPITLTFLLDGQPLDNAMVMFYTENQAIAKWTVGGITDAEGKAIIVTHGQFHGVPAGTFKVCVSKRVFPDEPDENVVASIVGSEIRPMGKMPVPIDHVDPLFCKPENTPLKIEIAPQKKMMAQTFNVHGPK